MVDESMESEEMMMPPMEGQASLVAVVELDEEQQLELLRQAEEAEKERQRILADLAFSIEKRFEERAGRRQTKEQEWVEGMRLYLGTLATFNNRTKEHPHGTTNATEDRPDHNLVKQKCKTAIAQGISMQFAGGDKNWDIVPTPQPEGGDIKMLELAAEEMETEIHDQLVEAKYGPKSREAYKDRVILGTGILKGPVPSRKTRISYEQVDDGMGNIVYTPVFKEDNKPVIYRVDPWFFFPDDSVNCIDDAEDAIELHPFGKLDLMKLKKNPGFIAEAIDELLLEEPREYSNSTFSEFSNLTESAVNVFRNKYAVLEYHGPVTKTQLGALDIDPPFETANEMYFGEVWVCQGKVLRIELEAVEGLYECPYSVCVWSEDPGSIFGFGLPLEVKDAQKIATAALHMLLDNSSDSSAPSVIVNKSLVEPADGKWELTPGKVWLATDYMLSNVGNAFNFFNVPNMQEALMAVLQMAREFGQEESGIPMLSQGLQSAQAGTDSATGLAILQQAATVISDFLAEQWDDNITEKIIRRMYHWNMQYNPNPEIKGDYEVDVRSSTEYRNKQLFIRDMEKLSVEAAQNPEMAKVINVTELTRVRLSMMHLPSKTIVKSQAQIEQEAEEAKQNPQPDPEMIKLQIEQERVEIEKQKLQLEAQRMQMEMQQMQVREQWENQERMGAVEARHFEAQARAMEAQLGFQTEMLKLAQQDEQVKMKIMGDLEKMGMQLETQQLLKGIDASMKAQDLRIKQEEAQIKRTMGSGY